MANVVKSFYVVLFTLSFSALYGSEVPQLARTILLINTQKLKQEKPTLLNSRRSYQTPFVNSQDNLGEFQQDEIDAANQNALLQDPDLITVPKTISSTFEAASDGSISTSTQLENLFQSYPANEEIDFQKTLNYLVQKKSGEGSWDISDGVFLSSFKSLFKSYVTHKGESPDFLNVFNEILPQIEQWGGNGPTWIKRLSQATIEGLSELQRPQAEILAATEIMTKALVDFINSNPEIEVPGMLNRIETVDANRKDPNMNMQFGGLSGFDPENFAAYQQLAVGLAQGFYNSELSAQMISEGLNDPDYKPRLYKESFEEFSGYKDSIIESATNSLLSSLRDLALSKEEDHSLYTYDSLKSLANGFVIASTVFATSEPDYLAEGLYTDAAELSSRAVAHSAITHEISLTNGFSGSRIAESVAHGSAMGAQLATVLPQSMDFVKNWEIFSQSRRDIAQAVSRGSSFGSVDAAAAFGLEIQKDIDQLETEIQEAEETQSDELNELKTRIDDLKIIKANYAREPLVFIEQVAQGASLGSMMGTTGLAIYYPTDQLVPIINFTAQGSAYGSVNPVNLDSLNTNSATGPVTEEIQVSLARQSALGSSMGAVFEPSVLLGLTPNTKTEDKQTIDNLSAASFGATYGAIQGRKEQDLIEASDGIINSKNTDDISITEILQSTKQGTTEGALAGATLALGLEDTNENNLNSKGVLLKAINSTNAKAATDAVSPLTSPTNSLGGTPLVGNPLRTSSKDMLLLMQKFGINPRYTNAATMFKRPVVPQLDEPPENLVSETNPVGDNDESYSESISNASPL